MPSLNPYLAYIKVAAMLIVILLACLGTKSCVANKYEAQIATMRAEQTAALAKKEQEYRTLEQEWAAAAALSERRAFAALQEKERENARLRNDVDAGAVRLRVKATCPVPAAPAGADAGGVDTGEGAELDAAARPAYHALRSGITRVEAKLAECQELLTLRPTSSGR